MLACFFLWSLWVLEKETKWSGISFLTRIPHYHSVQEKCIKPPLLNNNRCVHRTLIPPDRLCQKAVFSFSYSFYAILSSSGPWNNDLKCVPSLKILWLTTLFSICMYFYLFFLQNVSQISLFSLFFLPLKKKPKNKWQVWRLKLTSSIEVFCHTQCCLFFAQEEALVVEMTSWSWNLIVKTICFFLYALDHCSKYSHPLFIFVFKILVCLPNMMLKVFWNTVGTPVPGGICPKIHINTMTENL